MEWRRGGEVATMESDVYRQCQNHATVEGMRRMPLFGNYPTPTYIGRDPSGRPVFAPPVWSRSDQLMLEQTTLMQCMVGLGFDLVPIAQKPSQAPEPGKPGLEPGTKESPR